PCLPISAFQAPKFPSSCRSLNRYTFLLNNRYSVHYAAVLSLSLSNRNEPQTSCRNNSPSPRSHSTKMPARECISSSMRMSTILQVSLPYRLLLPQSCTLYCPVPLQVLLFPKPLKITNSTSRLH